MWTGSHLFPNRDGLNMNGHREKRDFDVLLLFQMFDEFQVGVRKVQKDDP